MSYVNDLAAATPLVKKAKTKPLSALTASLVGLCLLCGAVVSRTSLSPGAGTSGKVEQLDTTSLTTDAGRGYDPSYEGNYSLSRTNTTGQSISRTGAQDSVLIEMPGNGGPFDQAVNLGQKLIFELECEQPGVRCYAWKVNKAVYDSCDPSAGSSKIESSGNGGKLGWETTLWDYACLNAQEPGSCPPPVDYYIFSPSSDNLADGCGAGLKATVEHEWPPICDPEKKAYATCVKENAWDQEGPAFCPTRVLSDTPLAGPIDAECADVGYYGAKWDVCSWGSFDALQCQACSDEFWAALECVTQHSLKNYRVKDGDRLPGEACDCNCMCSGTNTCTAGDPPAELTPFSQCADAHHSDAACKTSAGLFAAAAGVAAAL